jgi:predicted neutral ceramidase superfamily lipid hydrolase
VLRDRNTSPENLLQDQLLNNKIQTISGALVVTTDEHTSLTGPKSLEATRSGFSAEKPVKRANVIVDAGMKRTKDVHLYVTDRDDPPLTTRLDRGNTGRKK